MDRQVETDRPSGTRGNFGEFTHNETCQFECLKARAEEQAAEASSRAGKNISGCVRTLSPLTLSGLQTALLSQQLGPSLSPRMKRVAVQDVTLSVFETREGSHPSAVSVSGMKKKNVFTEAFFFKGLIRIPRVCGGLTHDRASLSQGRNVFLPSHS